MLCYACLCHSCHSTAESTIIERAREVVRENSNSCSLGRELLIICSDDLHLVVCHVYIYIESSNSHGKLISIHQQLKQCILYKYKVMQSKHCKNRASLSISLSPSLTSGPSSHYMEKTVLCLFQPVIQGVPIFPKVPDKKLS